MSSINLNDVPFGGRCYAKIEALTLAALGTRAPAGAGDILLVYDGTTPYLYVPNSTLTGWIVFNLGGAGSLGALSDVIDGILSTKGNLFVGDGTQWRARPAPANGSVIVADSAQTTGWVDKEFKLAKLGDVHTTAPTDGQVPTWVAANSRFEYQTPASASATLTWARVKITTARTINAGPAVIIWDSEEADTINGFNLGTSATRFTAPSTGVYQHNVVLVADVAPSYADGKYALSLRKNGTSEYAVHLWHANQTARSIVLTTPLTEGDYVEVVVYTGGDTLNIYSNATKLQSYWEVLRIA